MQEPLIGVRQLMIESLTAGVSKLILKIYIYHKNLSQSHQYVYIHTDIPLLFQIRQYSEFETFHVNSVFRLDIPNSALF